MIKLINDGKVEVTDNAETKIILSRADAEIFMRSLMSNFSEEYMCAGWLIGLEGVLSKMIAAGETGDDRPWLQPYFDAIVTLHKELGYLVDMDGQPWYPE